jgi:hypothetical protein
LLLLVLRERELVLRDADDRELPLRVEPELPFELVFFAVERLRLDEDDAFGFAAERAFVAADDAAAFGFDAADFARDAAAFGFERDDDERELDDDDERELDAAAACGLRCLVGISAVTTDFVRRGMRPTRYFCIRSSSRRIDFATFAVSLSPSDSASATIAV